jgi:cytochrome oxidase assembly protein ShyY1
MGSTLVKILKFLGPLEPKENYSRINWIISGLSILIVIFCLTGLVFWQVKEHSKHHSGEDAKASIQSPFSPANNK